jgi:hypothetical protein
MTSAVLRLYKFSMSVDLPSAGAGMSAARSAAARSEASRSAGRMAIRYTPKKHSAQPMQKLNSAAGMGTPPFGRQFSSKTHIPPVIELGAEVAQQMGVRGTQRQSEVESGVIWRNLAQSGALTRA